VSELTGIALAFASLMIGGVLKGATGIGAPILAVPLLSALYGVPTAVVLFSLPNFLSNGLQLWQYRSTLAPLGLVLPFVLSGFVGAGIGTLLLVRLSPDLLQAFMAVAVFVFIAFRLARPEWVLPLKIGRRIATPVGLLGGIMFGSIGLSAPLSVPFLNALRLGRDVFVSTISAYFFALALMQIPMLVLGGIMSAELAAASLIAVVPLWLGMPIGAFLARHVATRTFDRLTLAILGLIAARMLHEVLT
jgi:uncharacterized membrane protein YfcA